MIAFTHKNNIFINLSIIVLFLSRFSVPKPISSCTPKSTCAKQNHTNVHSAPRRSRIPAISPSTLAFTSASNPIDAKFVNANSPSYPICSSTFVRTRVTNHTSVDTLVAKKRSRNCPTCSPTLAAIKQTSRTNVTRATNASRMNLRYSSTFPSTRNRSTWRRTFASIAESLTHRKPICQSICRSMPNEPTRGHRLQRACQVPLLQVRHLWVGWTTETWERLLSRRWSTAWQIILTGPK